MQVTPASSLYSTFGRLSDAWSRSVPYRIIHKLANVSHPSLVSAVTALQGRIFREGYTSETSSYTLKRDRNVVHISLFYSCVMAVVSWQAIILGIIAVRSKGYDRDSAGHPAPHRDETITHAPTRLPPIHASTLISMG